jgi:hypothetical protein
MPVNTLQVANRLKAAEKEGRTAEELALVLGEIEADRYERLVTHEQMAARFDKVDAEFGKVYAEIGRLREEMNAEFGRLRAELHDEIGKLRVEFDLKLAQLEHRMTVRTGAMLAAAVAILGGINIFF